MTKKGIDVTRDWSESFKNAKRGNTKITCYTYKNNVPSKGKIILI